MTTRNPNKFWEHKDLDKDKYAKAEDRYTFSQLPALNLIDDDRRDEEVKNTDEKELFLETKNVAHCFSRSMVFEDFLKGLNNSEHQGFLIDNLSIEDFLYGNHKQTKISTRKYI